MILDASALLAYLQKENGYLEVERVLSSAFISTVNWSEVAQKLQIKQIDFNLIRQNLEILGLQFISFNIEHANKASELFQVTSPLGLSLGDRACLATGIIEKMPVITADQIWQKASLPLKIILIR